MTIVGNTDKTVETLKNHFTADLFHFDQWFRFLGFLIQITLLMLICVQRAREINFILKTD